jgi:hydrogenase maturation protein HypF
VAEASSEERQVLLRQLEAGINTPDTSSLGRLFDAAAALAGVRQRVDYEAQAACEFEAASDRDATGAYEFGVSGEIADPAPVIRAIAADVRAGAPVGAIAERFHRGVANLTAGICRRVARAEGLSRVALTGGVWQNRRLLELTLRELRRDGLEVLLHRLLPPNDGGLALGQLVVGAWAANHGHADGRAAVSAGR